MDNQIVRVMNDFAGAERAREELLAAGFGSDQVQMTVYDDESGPGQANFTVGDSPGVKGGTDYKDTYAPTDQERGPCMLIVSPLDADQAGRAAVILQQHGARDPDLLRHGGH